MRSKCRHNTNALSTAYLCASRPSPSLGQSSHPGSRIHPYAVSRNYYNSSAVGVGRLEMERGNVLLRRFPPSIKPGREKRGAKEAAAITAPPQHCLRHSPHPPCSFGCFFSFFSILGSSFDRWFQRAGSARPRRCSPCRRHKLMTGSSGNPILFFSFYLSIRLPFFGGGIIFLRFHSNFGTSWLS